MAFNILRHVPSIMERGLRKTRTIISRWTKPTFQSPVLSTIADLTRSTPQLVAENLLLRQHLIILNRAVKRPRFTVVDRGRFGL